MLNICCKLVECDARLSRTWCVGTRGDIYVFHIHTLSGAMRTEEEGCDQQQKHRASEGYLDAGRHSRNVR